MKNILKSEKGQALIIIVVAMIGLLGLTALTVDGGYIFSDRRHAQNAADTASMAAARAKIRGEVWKDAGQAVATANGYDNNGTSNTVAIYECTEAGSLCGLYAGSDEYIQVIITSEVKTFFARVIGISEVTNGVMAIAHVKPSVQEPAFDGNAIVGLSLDECKAIKFSGSGTTTVIGGGIYANSDCDNAFSNTNAGSAHLNASSLCVAGGYEATTAVNIPSKTTDCAPKPIATYIYPSPSCSGAAQVNGSSMTAGSWSGPFPPNGVTNFESGTYCVDGNFSLNAGNVITGSDVFFYVEGNHSVTWNGGADINLDGPNSGPFAGLLIYADDPGASIEINGSSSSAITGTILAPYGDATINGSGGIDINSQIISDTIDLNGSQTSTITYNSADNWNPFTSPVIEEAQ